MLNREIRGRDSRLGFACPYCYADHTYQSLIFKCGNISCDNIDSIDKDGFVRVKKPKRCVKCRKPGATIYCPNRHFGIAGGNEGFIAPDVFRVSNVSIATIGAEASGKDCYMASLLNELRYTFPRFFPGELSNANEKSARIFNEQYYIPLFEQGRIPVAARGDKKCEPICYHIRMADKSREKLGGIVTLNFCAGYSDILLETTEQRAERDPELQRFIYDYLRNADVIFLVIDPLSIPTIRRKVLEKAESMGDREKVEKACPSKSVKPREIIEKMMGVLDPNGKARVGGLKTHLAVIFTKIDILEKYYPEMSGSNRLCAESRHLEMRSYNRREHKVTTEAAIDLIVKHMSTEAVLELRKFRDYSFFGVSAINGLPDKKGRLALHIGQKRVLDPLLWALAEKKLIEKTW